MAHGRYVMVAIVLVALTVSIYGCSDSTTAPTTPDEAPLVAPSAVTANVVPGGILVSWDANTQPHLRGYNLYRKDAIHGTYTKLNPVVVTVNQFLDRSTVWRSSYDYRVTAVSVGGSESTYSAVSIINQAYAGKKDPRPRQRD